MRRLGPVPFLLAALLGAPAGPAPSAEAGPTLPELEPGASVAVRLARGEGRWTRPVRVPDGARRVHVFTASRQNVDVGLSRAPVQGDLAVLPHRRLTASGEEHLAVESPRAGRWFVTVDHPAKARGGARFEVGVVVEGEGEPVLVASEGEGTAVPAGSDPVPAVAWIPLDAAWWSLEHGGDAVTVEDRRGARTLEAGRARRHPVRVPGLHRFGVLPRAEGTVALEVGTAPSEGPPLLRPGEEAEFALGGTNGETADFRIVVPAGVPGLEVSCATEPGHDFDLYARLDRRAEGDVDEDDAFTLTTGAEDVLTLGGEGGVEPGTWHLRVRTTDDDEAAAGTILLRPRTRARAIGARDGQPPAELVPATWTEGRIRPGVEGTTWYRARVPVGASSLTVQVVQATSDVEVVLADAAFGRVRARAITDRIDERLTADLSALEIPEGAALAVGVVNLLGAEEDVRFRVAAAFDREPPLPPELAMPPYAVPDTANDLERAAMAVVEVSCPSGEGSGVCVSPGGILLTARHVLADGDEPDAPLCTEGILVSFPFDRGRPPRQSHVARLVASDVASDLALLRITADVYGRPIPDAPNLPFLPIEPEVAVRLGDPLSVLGYPGAASERSRTPVIVVRGIVSGVETDPIEPPWIKTDAHISTGHSGGPVLDARLRLVGVASATLGEYDQLGLVRPLSALPVEWRARIREGAGTPRTAPPGRR